MTVSKIIFTALTGSITVLVLLLGAWMRDVDEHQTQAEQRMTTTEAHFASIQTDIQDLREDMHELRSSIDAQRQEAAQRARH